ncbi:hypothetical protein HU200_046952 [Digitaria exilis]|uniref:R13L1/DRL21-like LRR repeat region domain-containing protein n=1 Tax=Digitaria exilis TaxID=1010633 RepID=A0A835B381_9POAL|nr:hypothetical protein HU200_046952 [Digitaria exilis]
MTALRHLYTHECWNLKCMPLEIGRLTSLQTLTNFVVGTGSACSSIREVQHLNDLGGSLQLSQLENVTEAKDAKQASLGNKKDLRELSLTWRREMEKQNCHKVLESLQPPLGLEALRISNYQGTNFPTWMGMMPNMVELHLYKCNMSEKLPPLGSVPVLQVLRLEILEKMKCLCSGGTFFNFPSLMELRLNDLPEFDRWCEVNWVQREKIMFPRLQKLFIKNCGKLTALPGATRLGQSCSGDYEEAEERQLRSAFPMLKVLELQYLSKFHMWEETDATQGKQMIFPQLEDLSISQCEELATLPEGPELGALCGGDYGKARSAFPALKVLKFCNLKRFERWGTDEAAQGQVIVFPRLENLSIFLCQMLIALPEGPLLGELCGGDYEKVCSAFPALRILDLSFLGSFQSWEEVKASQRGDTMFPHLEELFIGFCRNLAALPGLKIRGCPGLTTLPESRKLSVLEIREGSPQISAAIPRVIDSLSILVSEMEPGLSAEHGAFELVDGNNKFPLTKLEISRCNLIYHSSAMALWTCFVQLQHLVISWCDALIYWPEEFQSLVSLRSLHILDCRSLTGYAPGRPGASVKSQLLPHMEFLVIRRCKNLVEIFDIPASLERMDVESCPNLESIFGKQEDKPALNEGSTAAPELSSSARDHSPSLREICIRGCNKLKILSRRMDELQELYICHCAELRSLGEFSTLESLSVVDCKSLPSLPDEPQAYLTLRWLEIKSCPALKSLPSSLQQRLASLEKKDLDARYEGNPLN